MNISKYVSYEEVIYSDTALKEGLDNTPTEKQLELIKAAAINVFDKLREHSGGPIKINNVFRSKALNSVIGGSETSQHCVGTDPKQRNYGAAFDIDDYYWVKGKNTYNNVEMADYIRLNLDFDQLIYEYPINGYPKWIHFSYRPDGKNRKEVLIATKKGYIPYKGNESMIKNPELV